MRRRTHFRLEIPERVRDAFVGEHEPCDLHEGAARKTKDHDIGHDQPPGYDEFC
jgi:hypothetical protein